MTGPIGAALLQHPARGGMRPEDATTPDEWLLAMYDSGHAREARRADASTLEPRKMFELRDDHPEQCVPKLVGYRPHECKHQKGAAVWPAEWDVLRTGLTETPSETFREIMAMPIDEPAGDASLVAA